VSPSLRDPSQWPTSDPRRASLVVPESQTTRSSESSAKVPLGKATSAELLRNANLLSSSEVHRARSKKNGRMFALKKIIMHNEKDGVGILDGVQGLN